MAHGPNVPNQQYKNLVEEIYIVQELLDLAITDPDDTRTIVGDIKELFTIEAEILDMQDSGDWRGDDPEEIMSNAQILRTQLPGHLRMIADSLDPDIAPDFDFPDPGTREWYGILLYVTLLDEFSRPVEFPPNPTIDASPAQDSGSTDNAQPEDNGPECEICAEKYEDGDRDVSFPCHSAHRMCFSCLMNLVSLSLSTSCPYCRQIPFAETQS
ncbi:uncharacterized protein MELLADRAFT_60374 [Melampsora larici-populina 98AG31]|uniref:RING-type domain-containing protein n=1 Tax=Melampsora larici-populina (strain 98AG31 / pathotype 3-4-7) TaxID=747676 RepID=F4R9V5_MELLP|nr:uncharacterized protein MELLADRAFT_60374 [Melampsora larici-populina 98AG31]EGG10593.1 hypothetical protein MELLADRAFT_60374 [Melampsora larici-populina 98AG31]